MLLIIVVIAPLLGFSLPELDRFGSYLMVSAAIVLGLIVVRLSRQK